ncbi:MAG TPA: PAS domain S-box protein, partial [Actinomycetota bacterium]|nr:PAS domain S-box protein [Actinomycetota bacterium]
MALKVLLLGLDDVTARRVQNAFLSEAVSFVTGERLADVDIASSLDLVVANTNIEDPDALTEKCSSASVPLLTMDAKDPRRATVVAADLPALLARLYAGVGTPALARLAEAQQKAHLGNWEWDVIGDYVVWSDELYRLFGLEPGSIEIGYDTYLRLIHPDDQSRADSVVRTAMETHEDFAFDHRVILPNGETRVIHGTGSVQLDGSGRVIRMAGTAQDITERVMIQETVERLAAIVESASDCIVSTNLDGVITSWNRGAEAMYGYSAADVVGRNVELLIPDDRHGEGRRLLKVSNKGVDIPEYQTTRKRQDGSLVDISLTISPVRDRWGAVVGASRIARDITAQKRAEQNVREVHEAQERLIENMRNLEELRMNFLSTVSHELRSPLTPVIGYANTLKRRWKTLTEKEREDFIDRIVRNSERLDTLIGELLDFSRLESGKLGVSITKLHLGEQFSAVISNMPELLASHEVELGLTDGVAVQADPRLLARIIENLLTNAAKFSPPGSRIVIDAEKSDGAVVVSVADEGPGI